MLPSGLATIWHAWHLYRNGIVGGEKGASELWEIFIFLTKVIIEQDNLNIGRNISCLRVQVLKEGEMPLVFFLSALFSPLVIPLTFQVLTTTSRKRNQNYSFNYHFLSTQPLFPTMSWACGPGPPQAAHIQDVHGETFVCTLFAPKPW